ncbi:hypothetical protein TSAR_010059 [Trichomalopsis sarcophagae]|uniref:Uncharacterized protein n=1 Tax=Trichomalopsis sarcophagae TaxID=543379 RepID=A0A232EU11_9HYME|nr:hypothetical protein TSAR_010059 [Trichomalopsis sarcophagae]
MIVRCQINSGLDPACIRRIRSLPQIARNSFVARNRILSILQRKVKGKSCRSLKSLQLKIDFLQLKKKQIFDIKLCRFMFYMEMFDVKVVSIFKIQLFTAANIFFKHFLANNNF